MVCGDLSESQKSIVAETHSHPANMREYSVWLNDYMRGLRYGSSMSFRQVRLYRVSGALIEPLLTSFSERLHLRSTVWRRRSLPPALA